MRRWVVVGLVALLLFAGVGGGLMFFLKARGKADEMGSRNNLRQVAQFAANFGDVQTGKVAPDAGGLIPAATLANPALQPDRRLSFYVALLPTFDQKRQNLSPVVEQIDRTLPWDGGANAQAGRTRVVTLLCPGNPARLPAGPAGTNYVGIAGVGPSPARAGCFRPDAPTPAAEVTDGLSQTLLLGETANDLGPWIRGGFSTARGFDNGPDAKPPLGAGGQLGGCFPVLTHFALADGSVRAFTPRIEPRVLLGLATIAGGEKESLPPAE